MRNSTCTWVLLRARFQPVVVASCINRLNNVDQAMPFHNAALHGKNHLLRAVQRLQDFLEALTIELPNPGKGVNLRRWIAGGVDRFKAGESNSGRLGLDNPEVDPMNPTPLNANTPVLERLFTVTESVSCAGATPHNKRRRTAAVRFTAHSPSELDSHRQFFVSPAKLDVRGCRLVSSQRRVSFLICFASAGHFAASSA